MQLPETQEFISTAGKRPSPEAQKFIDKVIKRVYFIPDRYDIEEELAAHIEDSAVTFAEGYGFSREEAVAAAIEHMGDANEIGVALNRQHNPFIGYLWYISRIPAVLLCIVLIFQLIPILFISGGSILFDHPIRDIPRKEYVRHVKPNELIKIDNSRTRITDIIQTKDGTLHICYSTYSVSLMGLHSWSPGGIGTVKDEDGEVYRGGGYKGAGLYSRGRDSLSNFPFDKDEIIIEYDYAGRYYKLEIPLGEVGQQ